MPINKFPAAAVPEWILEIDISEQAKSLYYMLCFEYQPGQPVLDIYYRQLMQRMGYQEESSLAACVDELVKHDAVQIEEVSFSGNGYPESIQLRPLPRPITTFA
jgi:hypothetical protein